MISIISCNLVCLIAQCITAKDVTNADPQSSTTGRGRAQGVSVGHSDGLPLGSYYDAGGQGDGSQHNTGGDPSQSFYPPHPTSTIETKKKGTEVFI
jgi:hypothetical protein